MDGFPTPNSHGIVGNIDWGESLAVVAYKFPGLNMTEKETLFETRGAIERNPG